MDGFAHSLRSHPLFTHMSHSSINRVNILPRPNSRGGNIACQNNRNNETIDTDNSRHDNGNNVLHDGARVTDSGV